MEVSVGLRDSAGDLGRHGGDKPPCYVFGRKPALSSVSPCLRGYSLWTRMP